MQDYKSMTQEQLEKQVVRIVKTNLERGIRLLDYSGHIKKVYDTSEIEYIDELIAIMCCMNHKPDLKRFFTENEFANAKGVMTKQQIISEIQRIKGWQSEGDVLITILKGDIEIVSYHIGRDDTIEISDENDSIRLWALERNDIVPTMIRLIVDDVKSVQYLTLDETRKLHDYLCELVIVEFINGISIEFTGQM